MDIAIDFFASNCREIPKILYFVKRISRLFYILYFMFYVLWNSEISFPWSQKLRCSTGANTSNLQKTNRLINEYQKKITSIERNDITHRYTTTTIADNQFPASSLPDKQLPAS